MCLCASILAAFRLVEILTSQLTPTFTIQIAYYWEILLGLSWISHVPLSFNFSSLSPGRLSRKSAHSNIDYTECWNLRILSWGHQGFIMCRSALISAWGKILESQLTLTLTVQNVFKRQKWTSLNSDSVTVRADLWVLLGSTLSHGHTSVTQVTVTQLTFVSMWLNWHLCYCDSKSTSAACFLMDILESLLTTKCNIQNHYRAGFWEFLLNSSYALVWLCDLSHSDMCDCDSRHSHCVSSRSIYVYMYMYMYISIYIYKYTLVATE